MLVKKIKIILILVIATKFSFSQIHTTNIEVKKLPAKIAYVGKIKNAVEWKDSEGIHYVLTTATGEYKTKNSDGEDLKNAALYVYHYVMAADSTKLLWRIYDYEKDCEFDLSVDFMENSLSVTDLDKNGIAEVWVMYEIQCTSDVSPAPAKIIMYEGIKKYALRGEREVQVSEKEYMGGTYTLDNNFQNGNLLFKEFAEGMWKKYRIKKW